MEKICGHDREVLQWACTDPDPLNNAERERMVLIPINAPLDFSLCAPTPKQRAAEAVLTPSIVAEMLASEGRRFGWHLTSEPPRVSQRLPWLQIANGSTWIGLWVLRNRNELPYEYTINLPQARSILAAWLQLPNSATDEALKALRGGP